MTDPGRDTEQLLELPGLVRDRVAEGRAKARATRQRRVAEAEISAVDPVARVLVDVPLAHLDRPFDYAVPAAIIRDLDLLRPIYAQTAAYGHFGRELPDFSWEKTDRVDALKAAAGV